jgi:NAD(P)-dependent dehydrogenase (short-subunit alcohol dehydrogenase family)
MSSIEGKVCIVTGAGLGLGRVIAVIGSRGRKSQQTDRMSRARERSRS